MALTLPDFRLTPVPQNHPQRDVFTGALLFASPVSKTKTVWLWWVPGPGVERYFDVFVGWSPGVDTMPLPEKHEPQLYLLRGPHHDFPAAAIHLRQIQGESAVCGYTIPTPWDQVSVIKPMAPGENMSQPWKGHNPRRSHLPTSKEQQPSWVRSKTSSQHCIKCFQTLRQQLKPRCIVHNNPGQAASRHGPVSANCGHHDSQKGARNASQTLL